MHVKMAARARVKKLCTQLLFRNQRMTNKLTTYIAVIFATAAISLGFYLFAFADSSVSVDFETPTYTVESTIDGIDGWTSTGAAGAGCGGKNSGARPHGDNCDQPGLYRPGTCGKNHQRAFGNAKWFLWFNG